MREILFRAKRIDNGEWAEGFYQNRFDVNEDIEHLIFWRKSYTVWEYAKIDSETLCQYTGLKDKNGNRIWENDIVSVIFDDEIIYGEINYGTYNNDFAGETSGSLGFYIDWVKKGYFLRKNIGCWKQELEYAGNIFDNLELLKGE